MLERLLIMLCCVGIGMGISGLVIEFMLCDRWERSNYRKAGYVMLLLLSVIIPVILVFCS